MKEEVTKGVFRIVLDRVNAMTRRLCEGALGRAESVRCPWMVETILPDDPEVHRPHACLGLCGMFSNGALYEAVADFSCPVINFSNLRGPLPQTGNLLSDDVAVGTLAARHLLERGYGHFLAVGEVSRQYADERIQGFRWEVERRGFSCRETRHDFKSTLLRQPIADFVHQMEEELRPEIERFPPDTAIFVTNDWLASLVQHVILATLPERTHTTAVLGVDDEQHSWWYLGPLAGLSSVRPAFHAMGAAAMDWLMAHPGGAGGGGRTGAAVSAREGCFQGLDRGRGLCRSLHRPSGALGLAGAAGGP